MKKLLVLSLFSVIFSPNLVLASQSTGANINTLATTGQCAYCALTGLNSSQLASGASLDDQGTYINLPTRTSPLIITNLSNADLSGGTVFNCATDGVAFATSTTSGQGVNFSGANLQGATFNNCSLAGANFSNANLIGAKFIGGTNISLANFSGTTTNLSGASLSGLVGNAANFTDVPMYGADLSCSTFWGANFTGTGIANVTLSCPTGKTDLTGSTLAELQLQLTAD